MQAFYAPMVMAMAMQEQRNTITKMHEGFLQSYTKESTVCSKLAT